MLARLAISYFQTIVFTERKRRRWDQQASGDDTPAKKKSSWDQAEVRNLNSSTQICCVAF